MDSSELTTRILAIALALFLWTYVHMLHETPDVQRTIQGVPVTLQGEPAAGLMPELHEENRTITVQIKGPADRVNSVLIDEVKAHVDVSALKNPGPNVSRCVIDAAAGVRCCRSFRSDVTVITRSLTQKDFPVMVSFIASPPPGSTVGEYLIEPSTVTVEGPAGGGQSEICRGHSVDPNEPMTGQPDPGAACARRPMAIWSRMCVC